MTIFKWACLQALSGAFLGVLMAVGLMEFGGILPDHQCFVPLAMARDAGRMETLRSLACGMDWFWMVSCGAVLAAAWYGVVLQINPQLPPLFCRSTKKMAKAWALFMALPLSASVLWVVFNFISKDFDAWLNSVPSHNFDPKLMLVYMTLVYASIWVIASPGGWVNQYLPGDRGEARTPSTRPPGGRFSISFVFSSFITKST